MNRYICIHGHFYQPPRENPWLEDVELEDTAYPYHDWNEKITHECYAQNAASRILNQGKKIIDITNNYCRMSFNFGPTLFNWLEEHQPEVYEKIIEADKESQELYGGHGSAIAQAFNHMILPLANLRDKETQVIWGIKDFRTRFNRDPKGMWLPETAVDIETLEVLADNGILFTILGPRQAKRICKLGTNNWKDVYKETIDTRQAYICRLPNGRSINLFFYDGSISHDVAYTGLLQSGAALAQKLLNSLDVSPQDGQLAHIATDGETFGHHHRYGDMALAFCLNAIESDHKAKLTNYSQFLSMFEPKFEVEINERTSWSCEHGVERWRSDCGCKTGRTPSGHQKWREPLRKALDWLRDDLVTLYETQTAKFTDNPWKLRDSYINLIMDRSSENIEAFISSNSKIELTSENKIILLKLLEMQRNALLMYTSCGWFFDDLTGIESVQILKYASHAVQLAREIDGNNREPQFKEMLAQAPLNSPDFKNGKEVYEVQVQPMSVDLYRVGAHMAVSSLFEEYTDEIPIYCYTAKNEVFDRTDAGIQVLVIGRGKIRSNILLEENEIDFAVLHFGDHNLIGAVNQHTSDTEFERIRKQLKTAFNRGDSTEVMRIMNIEFKGNNYSLWHLFRDEQRRILYELLESTWDEIDSSFRLIYEHNYSLMQVMRGMSIPLPQALAAPTEFIINQDLCATIQEPRIDTTRLEKLVNEARMFKLPLDLDTIKFEAMRSINRMMIELEEQPSDLELLTNIESSIRILMSILIKFDLQQAQNIFFSLSKDFLPVMNDRVKKGNKEATQWVKTFSELADHLDVSIS